MSSKKILIVTKFFHPDITPRAFRAFELAKEFAKKGHDVTVLTTIKSYDYTQIEKEFRFTVKNTVKKEPKELNGGGLIRMIRFSLSHFFIYPFIFLSKYFKNSLILENGYDLLVSVAHPYPVHFGVALARKNNTKLAQIWIADCGDPFAGEQEGRLKYPFYYRKIEKWFCKQPDFITVPIEEAKTAYPKECKHKIKVIPQGLNFDEIKPSYIKGENKRTTFAYAGNLSSGLRDPRQLLDCLIEINRDFKFILYTRNKEFLLPYQEKLGNKLEFRDYIPRVELLKELGKMEFLVNLENKNSVQSPSKLIDYALLERPILSIKPFEVDKKILFEFLEGNYRNRLKVKNIDVYNIKNVANQFLSLISE